MRQLPDDIEWISQNLTEGQYQHYMRMRMNGQSHNMAFMLATRSFPGIKGTDSEFMKGTHHQDTPYDHARYTAAHAANIDTNGKRYISGLARYPNDPEAWVSGLGDVRRIVTDRGWNCHGALEHTGYSYEGRDSEPADVPIAKDIVNQHVASCLEAFNPREVTPKLIEDIKETVTDELSGRVNLSPEPRVSDYDDPFRLPGMESD